MLLLAITIIASWASLAGLLLTLKGSAPFSLWQCVLLVVITVGPLSAWIMEWRARPERAIRPGKNQKKKIRDYMYDWIKDGGRVAVFTRDMSWVSDAEMKRMLKEKAEADELTICLPELKPPVDELRVRGAKIHAYGTLGYQIKSRFTIIHRERGDSRVAIAFKKKNVHNIFEVSNGEHPMFSLAEDMIEILSRISK